MLNKGDLDSATKHEMQILAALLNSQFGQAHVDQQQDLVMLQVQFHHVFVSDMHCRTIEVVYCTAAEVLLQMATYMAATCVPAASYQQVTAHLYVYVRVFSTVKLILLSTWIH